MIKSRGPGLLTPWGCYLLWRNHDAVCSCGITHELKVSLLSTRTNCAEWFLQLKQCYCVLLKNNKLKDKANNAQRCLRLLQWWELIVLKANCRRCPNSKRKWPINRVNCFQNQCSDLQLTTFSFVTFLETLQLVSNSLVTSCWEQ